MTNISTKGPKEILRPAGAYVRVVVGILVHVYIKLS